MTHTYKTYDQHGLYYEFAMNDLQYQILKENFELDKKETLLILELSNQECHQILKADNKFGEFKQITAPKVGNLQYFVKEVKSHYDDVDILHRLTKEQSEFLRSGSLKNARISKKTISEIQKLTKSIIEEITQSEQIRNDFLKKLDMIPS